MAGSVQELLTAENAERAEKALEAVPSAQPGLDPCLVHASDIREDLRHDGVARTLQVGASRRNLVKVSELCTFSFGLPIRRPWYAPCYTEPTADAGSAGGI
jgi:hypothetical protein